MELNPSNPNSQSIDEVLEKLKQGMKAARGGGWIDSDSGSELEIALDHSIGGPGHPCRYGSLPRSINHHQHSLYIKDGIDLKHTSVPDDKSNPDYNLASAPFLMNNKSLNSRVQEISQPKARPLPTASINNHHHNHHFIDQPPASNSQESHLSSLFDTPLSPYAPRTPSTPVSAGTSSESPYVRHHFKWEYFAPSINGERAHPTGQPPRFVESSSPPNNNNNNNLHEESLPYSDWLKGCTSSKELFFATEPSHSSVQNRFNPGIQRCSNLSANFPSATSNGPRSVSYSPVHSKSHSPSQQTFGLEHNHKTFAADSRPTTTEAHKSSINEPSQQTWFMAAPGSESKAYASKNIFNPASVSSVSFSLAPAAPIRLTAPEGDLQTRKSLEREHNSCSTSSRELNPSGGSRETSALASSAVIPVSVSATSLKESAQEREKEVIRARLTGSSSMENFQTTRLPQIDKPFLATSTPASGGGHLGQTANLSSLFQQMRIPPSSSQPISSSQARAHPENSMRPVLPTYPVAHGYGGSIFYSSQPHRSVSRHSPFSPSSVRSASSDHPQMIQLATPQTPITPAGFGVNGHHHHPTGPNIPYPPPSSASQAFVPIILPATPGVGGALNAPLPGQIQPEEVRKSVKTQPPVVNTGNSGAMIPQPGDWVCICGFVNWRRRKVCMRCFPFADGNDSVGAMMAINAQRAAFLAAGIHVPNDLPISTSAITKSSPSLSQPSEMLSFHEPSSQGAEKQGPSSQILNNTQSASNHHRSLESVGGFGAQPQKMMLNPFDKSLPLDQTSSAPAISINQSPDGSGNERYPSGLSQESLVERSLGANGLMRRTDKNIKALRARIVAPGEEQEAERDSREASPKSPRPRSCSMGAKTMWGPNEEIEQDRLLAMREMSDSTRVEKNVTGQETNGISGSEKAVGSQVGSSRLVSDSHRELDTISNSGATHVNRQRTTTSPDASWQAIKALWQ